MIQLNAENDILKDGKKWYTCNRWNSDTRLKECDVSAPSWQGGVDFGITSGLSPISLLTEFLPLFSAAAPTVSDVS